MSPDLAASIHRRLLNRARDEGRPFVEVLQYYALQRFLYRLGASRHSRSFVLKGALMLVAWQSPVTRPTRDIDLLGRMANTVDEVTDAIREVAAVPSPEDGLRFDPASAVGERITEGAGYAGVRVRFAGYLGKARIPMQIDVGYGDAVVPEPTAIRLPSMLGLAPADLQGYTRESAIAEKLQVMLALGEINSRTKDYYDIWLLASAYSFEGAPLAAAIKATLARRNTRIVLPAPGLEEAYADAPRGAVASIPHTPPAGAPYDARRVPCVGATLRPAGPPRPARGSSGPALLARRRALGVRATERQRRGPPTHMGSGSRASEVLGVPKTTGEMGHRGHTRSGGRRLALSPRR